MVAALQANMEQLQDSIESIWQGVLAGQASMQRKLYNCTFKTMMNVCARYATTLEDAEQWVNDGYIKIFTNTDKFAGKGSVEGWMRRIMVNTCLDNLRQNKAQFNAPNMRTKDTAAIGFDYSTANEALQEINAEHLLIHVQNLPHTQRTIFNLYAMDGYSHKEIAQELGIKETNSQWHLNQARNILKEKILQSNNKNQQAR
jgi:RNA polymerase sigma factor (sigma-70 family)